MVRHRILVPAFGGSNPSSPARNMKNSPKKKLILPTILILVVFISFFFLYQRDNTIKQLVLDLGSNVSDLDSRTEKLDISTEKIEKKIVLLKEQGYVEIDDTPAIVGSVLPSVVFVMTKSSDSDYNKENQILITDQSNVRGTGFFISSDGYIATAKHVVSGLEQQNIEVQDNNGNRYGVDQIFMDENSDVSLIKIKSTKKHPIIKFGYFENLEIGDEVGVIGFNPGFDTPLLHKGNVSAKGLDENGLKMFTINSFVNKGNSGSPVFSLRTGRILGVLSARKSEAQTYKLLDPNQFNSGVSFGGIGDPGVLSATLYNETVKIVEEASQVGIGIVYSTDLVRQLMREYRK